MGQLPTLPVVGMSGLKVPVWGFDRLGFDKLSFDKLSYRALDRLPR